MNAFKPVILWTDALIYVLIAVIIVFVFVVRRREYLLAPWRRVAHSASGMSSVVVLSIFGVVGVLDSVHFRPAIGPDTGEENYSVEVRSLLDVIAAPLRAKAEKTYSAPFAAQLFSKETVTLPDGSEARVYPRLRHGGAHLENPGVQRFGDILTRLGIAVGVAVLAWLAISALLILYRSWRRESSFRASSVHFARGDSDFPWRAVLITIGVALLVIVPMIVLSRHYHVLGTDKVGQDVLYLAVKSIRTGLVIGTLTTLVMLPFALALGIMAGYFRGWIDDVIQYTYTTLSSIPGVLLIAAAVLMTQVYMDTHPEMFETVSQRADLRLLFLCIILGITSWTGLCRLLRGETLKLREMEYIQAAQAFGVSSWRITSRHILPNVMHIVLIAIVMDFSGLVLAEAVLSYVGVGVDPSMISFGTMINSARLEMAREPMVWWSLAAAFTFMFVLVLFANLFADAVRDAFDPRVRTRAGKAAARRANLAKMIPATSAAQPTLGLK
ncbi:MAG: ABC transporter permease [Burkholderiales bacterium]|nr:ABC transporter permease [Burkholderiales bacterium]